MNKEIYITHELLHDDKYKKFSDFIHGFIDNSNWTVSDNKLSPVVLTHDYTENVDLNNLNHDYVAYIANYFSNFGSSEHVSGDRAQIKLTNYKLEAFLWFKRNTSLYQYVTPITKCSSKSIFLINQKKINDNDLDNFEFGKLVSGIISDGLLVDEYLKYKKAVNSNEYVER